MVRFAHHVAGTFRVSEAAEVYPHQSVKNVSAETF